MGRARGPGRRPLPRRRVTWQGGEAGKGADDVRGVRAAQGPREPGGTEPRVGDHDRRPGPPAGVRGGGQIGAGRNEQSHAAAGRDPVVGQADRELVDAPDEQVPGDRAAAGRDDGGGAIVRPRIQRGPQRGPGSLTNDTLVG